MGGSATVQTKYWCFTLFEYPYEFKADLHNWWMAHMGDVQYICGQIEVCPTTKKDHFQGYIEYTRKKRLSEAKACFIQPVHLEMRRGTQAQAIDYTRKRETGMGGSWVEFGERTRLAQGERNDLSAMLHEISSGASYKMLFEEYPGNCLRYGKGIARAIELLGPQRNWKTQVIVITGPPGTGKSRLAHTTFPEAYCRPNGAWFDGYDRDLVVICDDFYGGIPHGLLLNICDRYPLRVPVKGAFAPWVPRKIIFTSNSDPTDWYHNEAIDYAALDRRIDLHFKLTKEPLGWWLNEQKTNYSYMSSEWEKIEIEFSKLVNEYLFRPITTQINSMTTRIGNSRSSKLSARSRI